MDDVWLDGGVRIPVGTWVRDPCWRCGRQPESDEVIQIDWMLHTVLCGVCHSDDQRRLAQALADASKKWWADQSDGEA